MKTKSTIGRLMTHLSEWRESGARVAAMLLLMTAGTTAAMAADWVLNEDKYSATHYTDHLYLEVFLADLDNGNTYCQEGTVTATNGSKSVDLLKFKYINEGDDENETAEVKAQLVMPNAKAYFTNSSGSSEIGYGESSYWLKKWGSDNHYMTAKVDFYYSSEMAGGGWKIYFHFKHSDGKWYDKTLSSWVGTSDHLGLYDYDWKSYKIERTGIDKLTFTVPQLPNDIDSKLSSVRMRQATYDVVYTFVKQDGSTATLSKTYEADSNEKNEEVSFPDGVGNPARINYKVTAVHGVKDPSNWFNRRTNSDSKEDAFKIVPAPDAITTEYHQFDHQTVLTWTTPKGTNYLDVTPYIYRIQTDANGKPKSGASWSKRGALTRTSGGAMTFTDDDAEIGTYYKYMVVNIPSDYIGNTGISEASLNNLSDDLLSKVGSNSALVNTAPVVTIYNLQQDTTQKSSVYLTWQYSRVPVDDASVTFKILRRTTADGPWSEYATASGDANPAAGVKLPYEDKALPNSIVRYQYKVRLELAGGYRFESLPVTAGLLAGARLIDFTATKGVHANVVTLAWKAQQAGTANCNFIISRRYLNSDDDFIQIYSYNGADANYSYDDINAMPGYYYEYRIQLFEAGVLQSTLYAVGFSQARGAVGGRVSYGTGTAVPGVRLWLRPADTGNGNTVKTTSQYVYGASEGIAWKASETEIEKIFGSNKDYTMQFFVRPEEGMNDGAVLANIPGAGLITLKKRAETHTEERYQTHPDTSYVERTEVSYAMHQEERYKERTEVRYETHQEYGSHQEVRYEKHIRGTVKTTDLSTITDDYIAQNGEILTGTLGGNYRILIASGATVLLRDVTINGTHLSQYNWAGLSCVGDATIVLEGNNTIQGFYGKKPGIYIGSEATLTIKGSGSLNASSNSSGAGIGAGAEYPCGSIVIEGGSVNATGNYYAAGIGGADRAICENITIKNTVTRVTATKGYQSPNCIGRGTNSACDKVTIGGTVYWDGSNYQNGGKDILEQESYTYTGTNPQGDAQLDAFYGAYATDTYFLIDTFPVTVMDTFFVDVIDTIPYTVIDTIIVNVKDTISEIVIDTIVRNVTDTITETVTDSVYNLQYNYLQYSHTDTTYITNTYTRIDRHPKTTDLSTLTGDYTAQNGEILTGTLGGSYKISIADGATVCLRNVTINGTHNVNYRWAGITCPGDATLVLEGNNTVRGFYEDYPGIYIAQNKTLTIRGSGSLNASSNGLGSGIGGANTINCGSIVIEGGDITATGTYSTGIGASINSSCGSISIKGGVIKAQGGAYGAGIGSVSKSCGKITIANTVTSVTATRGDIAGINSIGPGSLKSYSSSPTCDVVTIGGTVYWDGSNYQNGGDSYLTQTTLTYSGTNPIDNGNADVENFYNTYTIDIPVTVTDTLETYTPVYDTISSNAVDISLPVGKYTLLTLSKTGNQMSVQADKGAVQTFAIMGDPIMSPFSLGGAEGITDAQAFKGNFAEVRVYKKILKEAEKNSYFDRTLTGREEGLALYWPLDEGLERYAFDASYLSDQPNGRHATVGKNITPSAILPAEEQLSRYGVTSETGDYSISGIPFLGSGSTYTVVPEKGIHKFNPTSRSFMITPNVLTMNNIDFTDESSFPMTGHIYYAGTNIPAEGIQLYIDGMAASANGKALQTDANGYYAISVPIGEHYVEAQLMGHTLVDGGRFPIEGTYNFADRVQHDFIDSTLVNFVGRVAGAKYNDTIPVGFGESHNNIGAATITLKLNNASFSFNCENDYITPAKTVRTYESDTASIRSHAWTDAGAAEAKYIKIVTDSLTGEFSALLPPLKYVMQSVVVEKNGGVEFTALSDVDLTNPSLDQTDSICRLTEQGDTVYNHYSYNSKKVLTYYSTPQVDVAETGHAGGAFGLDSVIIAIDEEHNDTVRNLYTLDSLGIHYMFGYPVYKMLDGVEYAVHAYETYTNYDGALPVTDTVNLNGQELTIGNEMSASQQVIYDAPEDSIHYIPGEIYEMMYNKITLDRNGRARIPWTVGLPNIVKPFSRHFNITLKRDDRTYEPYRMDAIVLGALTTGNNFVTKGPDNVKFILRDPYGAHSYTTLKTGTVHTVTKYDSWEVNGEHSLKVDVLLGTSVTTATGIGVAVINTNKVATEITAGAKSTWATQHKKDSVFQTTTVESVSTSSSTNYVGAKGDVYVGTSNNILIGTCRKVQIKQNVQTGKYEIVLDDAMAMGEKVSTSFAYTQYELEKVMIPKWKDQRKQFLTQVASEQAARSYVNTGKRAKCVTWLHPADSNYGEAGTYVFVAPQNPENEEVDSVEWCNNQITAWQNCIRRNEEAKIKAINGGNFKNYSIDGGSSRTYTHRNDTTGLNQSTTTYNISAIGGWKQGWQIKNFAFVGIQTNLETSVGGGQTTGTGDDNGSFTEWEYVLSDGNRDVDISMNVYDAESGNNSKIFSLFGGQTYNPYEPADSTHYYTNAAGQYLPLGNTTVRMEQPFISIGKVNEAPGKHTTLTDIPAGQTATAILYCTNMGNTNQGRNFSYDLSISESTNPHGLEILMDGTPITDRAIYLEQGQTTQKVITVRQTDESILDFDSIELWFASQYQPLTIYDIALLSAHFVPSSSPVDLTIANPVLNTDPTTGKGLLQMKLSGINRQFKNLKKVGVQYRFAGNTQWTTFHTWVVNEEDLSGKDCEMLPPTGDLKLNADMEDNISYPEGDYEFRAFTMTPYGHEDVYAYSEVTKVIKDMTLPRPLYTPAPANGILGIGEQLAVEFNEDIVPGYVGDKNIIVTAKLNGQPIDHEVSMHIRPFGEEVRTENPLFLSGNFSMEFWLKHYDYGTILRQGGEDGNFGLSIDRDGFVEINIAGAKYTSEKAVPMDEWTFFAMNYKAETMTFNMIAQYDTTTLRLFTDQVVSDIDIDKVSYSDDNYLYLGPIDANIHDLAIYNIYRDALTSAADKYVSKDTYTYGLTNYWRMDEGHGFVAADTRRTHNLIGKDAWDIINTNYSLRMDSMAGAQVDISLIPTRRSDSYAIELWYNPALFNGVDTVFETAIPTVMGDMQLQADKLCLRYDTAKNLVLDYGVKSRIVASHTDFPDVSGWHHFALNVVRGQAASFYLDGSRTAVIAEADVPNLSGSTLVFAKNAENAKVDELRIWRATLSEDRLLSNRYNTIDTADLYSRGLVAYYPFEKDSTINGVATKGETLENMAPRSLTGNAGDVQVKRYMAVKATPPIKNAPSETRITAMPVASERKVVINLAETEVTARDLEGTTLNITMAEVHDLHGNMSEPIKWTAYVQQNTLLWAKDSVNITKQYGEDYTFDVNIENKGGQTEYYTVENMPSWLSLVDGNGLSTFDFGISTAFDVQPLKTKTLRFAVNPLVPVGNYDVTIGVQGNKGILEPLRIVMKVRGETPNWTVDPTKYDHSMTIIGQVYLSGILMENPESMVAAFIGGECRGVAAPKKIRGAAYETLIIYGSDTPDADQNQPLSFRIWDASKGIAYTDANIKLPSDQVPSDQVPSDQVPSDQVPSDQVIFRQDTMIGNFNTPAIWTKSDRVEQLIPVHENWNWIAFGVEPPSEYCDLVFTPQYKGWNVLVKDQETFSQSSGSTFNGPLKLAVNRMYKLRILRTTKTASATLDPQLSVSGKRLPSDSMGVMIEHGWNWLPYTPLSTMVVDEALAGVQPKWGDIIKSQTGVSVYDIYGWEGTLTALEPGHGYLYYSTDSTAKSFSYPDLTASVSRMQRKLMAKLVESRKSKVESQRVLRAYPSNMTMTIRLMDGEAVVDTCEISAYIGGECRGAVRAHTDSLYYLVIAGDGAGQPMELRTIINGEEIVIDKTLTFVSDNHLGTPWEPYVIQLNAAEGVEEVPSDQVPSTKVRKVLIDGILYIERNGERYDVTGKKL